MKLAGRGIWKWGLRLLLVPFALVGLYIGILVYPSPLFAHAESYGDYRVYAEAPILPDFARVIEDLDRRIDAMEHPPLDASQRIYLCSPERFSFFALLTRKNPNSLAIGLSVANESFVNLDHVRLFAARNHGVLRHTRFEGNMAEVVAHEIAHFHSVHALGYRAHLGQPVWKSEGWAEYQANLAAIRADPDYDLRGRIERLLDDGYWSGQRGIARSMWEWQLLVEFLGEVEGYHLADLVRPEVTESSIRARMMAWYREPFGDPATPGR